MPIRTEEQKKVRKEEDRRKAEEYKSYYSTNQDLVQACRKCGDRKPLRKFLPTYAFRTLCKECHRGHVSGWRDSNPEPAGAIKARSFRKSAEYIRSKKLEPCCECQRKFPFYVMDFHHVMEKAVAVSRLYEKSRARLDAEMAKCVLICANCHRDESFRSRNEIPTSKDRHEVPEVVEVPLETGSIPRVCAACGGEKDERNFTTLQSGKKHSYCKRCLREKNRIYASRREKSETPAEKFIREHKDNKLCTDCKETFRYWMLDMDHRDPGVKDGNVNRMRSKSLKAAVEEVAKCDLVCVNCHRERTWRRNLVRKNSQEAPFSLKETTIRQCQSTGVAEVFLKSYHYAGFGRPASMIYEVLSPGGDVMAILKFAPPMRKETATRLSMDVSKVMELDRFCVSPDFQYKNVASRSLGLALRRLRQDVPETAVIVSFADLEKDHYGGIYRASNWEHDGMAASSHHYVDRGGKEIHKKTVYNRAVALVMTEREFAESEGLKKVRTAGKHRFLYWMDRHKEA